ncbi:MAG TPA: IscS subfamily cysteine desulfurase [Marinobacter hydrocarbonoclasticus]|uniref:IscS subfamily cysteine desulfurase n=1 Tax=Marinobacter TaxID=2742 RepID=UPI000C975DAA|nr:IscS subfamily cysteine desulfurase [Marinobacter sp.]MAC22265.1 IscS subfamily cysteine desulfurase [Marinobacter sp.]HCL37162.1 IscS subfamily cysteine desulfurase [Marinobacter nauticus]HCR47287.1 IscS subfamily cysteine desulfurase [Marinobacter nauticus]|tara:strand:- start:363 stop:1511 length:1149 start_codon:yes stop_codon:yes gene_type:complete
MKKPVYLDYAATTPVDPAVAEDMMKYLTLDGVFGNPASRSHGYGWQAEAAVENARRQVADLIHADPREIVWTSGATESDNLAIKGVAELHENPHIVTSRIEHKAVIDTCKWLEQQGAEVTWLEPGGDGRISVEAVESALRDNTVLVSLMMVNNELGSLTDIRAIGQCLRKRGVLFHVDAAQAAGKLAVDVADLEVDLLSLSAHKVYGPKGVGALYVRRAPEVRIAAQMHGGGHERGMRSGTLATHQIVGMGRSFELARTGLDAEISKLEQMRAAFLDGLERLDGVHFNGSREHRVPGIVNLSFEGVEAESLMLGLRNLAVSSGSACASATVEPSYVLRGIGVSDELAHRALRFSFGRFTTEEEVAFACSQIIEVVERLRSVR